MPLGNAIAPQDFSPLVSLCKFEDESQVQGLVEAFIQPAPQPGRVFVLGESLCSKNSCGVGALGCEWWVGVGGDLLVV